MSDMATNVGISILIGGLLGGLFVWFVIKTQERYKAKEEAKKEEEKRLISESVITIREKYSIGRRGNTQWYITIDMLGLSYWTDDVIVFGKMEINKSYTVTRYYDNSDGSFQIISIQEVAVPS